MVTGHWGVGVLGFPQYSITQIPVSSTGCRLSYKKANRYFSHTLLDSYGHAILLRGNSNAEAGDAAAKLEREIFLRGYYKAFAFGSGPCRHCQQCDTSQTCKHPYKARPAMEASGIDVFQTARSNGFPIEVVTSREQQGDYYGLVLID